MSDIQPGDVVVCVDDFTQPRNNLFPPIGSLLTAGRAYRVIDTTCGVINRIVVRVGGINPWWFESWRFRKIRPADEQFTQHIRALVREDA